MDSVGVVVPSLAFYAFNISFYVHTLNEWTRWQQGDQDYEQQEEEARRQHARAERPQSHPAWLCGIIWAFVLSSKKKHYLLFSIFLFFDFLMPNYFKSSGIGKPSFVHALVVIFLEFFAWGLLTDQVITVSVWSFIRDLLSLFFLIHVFFILLRY